MEASRRQRIVAWFYEVCVAPIPLMAKVISVCRSQGFALKDMADIRWLKISQALARAGHQVDMAMHGDCAPLPPLPNLRSVELSRAKWNEYDAVKTVFHGGFELLEEYGGAQHPFIISKLGSVAGARALVEQEHGERVLADYARFISERE